METLLPSAAWPTVQTSGAVWLWQSYCSCATTPHLSQEGAAPRSTMRSCQSRCSR